MTSALNPIHAFHISREPKMDGHDDFRSRTVIFLDRNTGTFFGSDESIIIV